MAPIRHTTEVLIAGWAPATANARVLGALLLGAHNPAGELVYLGDVGTGCVESIWAILSFAPVRLLVAPSTSRRPSRLASIIRASRLSRISSTVVVALGQTAAVNG